MDQRNVDILPFEFAYHIGEHIGLLAGIRFAPVVRVVGDGEVGEEALDVQARERLNRLEEVDDFTREQAKAAHAAIDLHVDDRLARQRDRRAG